MNAFDACLRVRSAIPLSHHQACRLRVLLLLALLLASLAGCGAREGAHAPPPPPAASEDAAAVAGEDAAAVREDVDAAAAAPDPGDAAEPLPAPPPAAELPATAPPSKNGGPPTATLPSFPWPPPRYSAFSAIERQWLAEGEAPVLGDVALRLERAFDAAGYAERSYYRIPGGFALVSRIEQIREDASPFLPPARWAVGAARVREGFIDHIRALFNAPPGFYRVIVFAVTDEDFAAGARAPTATEAREWITGGGLRLPEGIALQPYGARHYTTALIYEFERRGEQAQAAMRVPSPATGRMHLEKAGLWQALAVR